jgi:hypothetical protein
MEISSPVVLDHDRLDDRVVPREPVGVGVGGGQHPSELEASGVHQLDDALALRMREDGRVDQLADVRPRPACGYLAFRADSIYFKDLGEPSLNPRTIPACFWRMVDQGQASGLLLPTLLPPAFG